MHFMNLLAKLKACLAHRDVPEHLRRGKLGERAAKRYLKRKGLKFLMANFRSGRGEIDLIFRTDTSIAKESAHSDHGTLFLRILGKCIPINRLHFTPITTHCLVFVEVKTRSSEDWERPAAAVDKDKREHLTRCGLDYLRLLKNPLVKVRFDIVEVLLERGRVREMRHLPNAFSMPKPYRYL